MVEQTALVVKADKKPQPGIECHVPNQIYCNPKLSIELREYNKLEPGYIRLQMLMAGICGTDVHVVKTMPETGYIMGTAPLDISQTSGRVLGHEGVGKVIETGPGVTNVKLGDYVTLESIITCKTCKPCRTGMFNQCKNAKLLGLEKDGLFGGIADVPSELAHIITDMADTQYGLVSASCVEPAGCSYLAATSAKISPGENVLIFGAGPIGTMAAMLCREVFGAAEIHVVEPVKFRRDFVRKWASHVYDSEGFYGTTLKNGIDVVIEASGVVDNVNNALRRMAPNGRVAVLARSGKPLSIQHIDYMITNSITIFGTRGHLCGAFDSILHLIRSGRLPLQEVVTDTISGLDALKGTLENPNILTEKNCKVIVNL